MFVDASVLTAIVVGEADADPLTQRLQDAGAGVTSAIALWEASVAVARIRHTDVSAGLAAVQRFVDAFGLRTVAIGEPEATAAVAAHARYGKGSGHPARLNMGDCFAYACARTADARLLYKGDDFSHTDMA